MKKSSELTSLILAAHRVQRGEPLAKMTAALDNPADTQTFPGVSMLDAIVDYYTTALWDRLFSDIDKWTDEDREAVAIRWNSVAHLAHLGVGSSSHADAVQLRIQAWWRIASAVQGPLLKWLAGGGSDE